MKIAWLFLYFVSIISNSANTSTITMAQTLVTSDVQLKITIVRKEISRGDDDLYAVNLTLKLQFVNQGDAPVLIHKTAGDISHIWISENEQKLTAKEYEQNSRFSLLVEGGKSIDEMTIDDFMVLNKRETFETETSITLFVPYDTNKKVSGAISPGSHVLQLQALSWTWDEEGAEKISKKYRKHGVLWTKPIISEPMNLFLEKKTECLK